MNAENPDKLLERMPKTTLTALFEARAVQTPASESVVAGKERLTYKELNTRANRLAHALLQRGVQRNDIVGLAVERGADVAIGILAILKAGAAYLPLDLDYPLDRLAFVVGDAKARLVLAGSKVGASLQLKGAECLDIATAGNGFPDTNPDVVSVPEDLAYVIYTSGSTGKPKGVLITHANVTRLFRATEPWFAFGAHDVWTLFHSYAFDFSVWELWGALLYGGRLVVVPFSVSRDPAAFRKLLVEERVTILNQTPSAFRQLVQADLDEPPATYALREIIFGGEALELQSLKPWIERYGDARPRLVNMYGITETTVHVTYRPITRADLEASRGSVIGRPIPDLYIRLLDERGEPVPVGAPGEIWVGGAGVANGYLNRPDLTAQRFVTDPFDPSGSGRLYRAGDLARRLPDGDLEYLGRVDAQVKIRGFRIELGEIEARLAECEGVSEVNVIAREDTPGDKRLAAYYVAGANVRPEALRAHLLATLPEYMVPAAYVRLDRMPLTLNGKLDRKALPPPDSRAYVLDAYEAPAGPVEEKLARIWAAVLGLDRVSRNANFFASGGHSLLAVKMLTLIEAEFGHSLNLTSLFRAPSIATLAELLQQRRTSSGSSSFVVSVQPEGTKPPLFAITAPTLYREIAGHLGKTQPVIGLEPFNPLKRLELKYSSLEDVAGEFVKLIREIQPQGPYAVIGWCIGGALAFETAQQLVRMGHDVSFIGIIDGWAPYYTRRWGGLWLKAADFATRCKRLYAEKRAARWSVKSSIMKPFTWFGLAPRSDANTASSDPELEMIEQRAQEFSRYLWSLQDAYEPKPFHGRLHVFVSQYRPTGWLADSSLGWGRLATGGAEAVNFEGDHESIFHGHGAGLAAAIIAAALKAPSTRKPSKAPSSSATMHPNGQLPPADPLVSIVIPAYNAVKDIARAIRCAISQTYLEIEVIIVDDGSQDGTAQAAREIMKSSFKGRWSVLELGVNRGASASRNAALKQARGEWIQFLDSDDAMTTDKIEAQMKYARTAGPDVSAIYSSWRHVYLENGNFVPAGPVNTPRYEGKHPLMFCMYYAGLHHGACLIRRRALERIHGFDETMRSFEDADLLVRLAQETGRFQFVESKNPSYLWRLYKEEPREGGENARYKLEDTAMNWLRVVRDAAGNQQIGDILSTPDDVIVWRQHCTSYARRLFESNAGALKPFVDGLRSVDPDFIYPPADGDALESGSNGASNPTRRP